MSMLIKSLYIYIKTILWQSTSTKQPHLYFKSFNFDDVDDGNRTNTKTRVSVHKIDEDC